MPGSGRRIQGLATVRRYAARAVFRCDDEVIPTAGRTHRFALASEVLEVEDELADISDRSSSSEGDEGALRLRWWRSVAFGLERSPVVWPNAMRNICEEGKEKQKRTSWDDPYTTFGNRELVRLGLAAGHTASILLDCRRANRHQNLALVHKEHHLHLARVFRALETLWWQLDDTGAKEWEGHYLGVLEGRSGNVPGHNR